MSPRHAAMIRQGLMLAHHDHLHRYVKYAPRLTRRAFEREREAMWTRECRDMIERHEARAMSDCVIEQEKASALRLEADRQDEEAGLLDPDQPTYTAHLAAINAEQAEHLRRFYA